MRKGIIVHLVAAAWLAAVSGAACTAVRADTIAIIGTGNVGSALGRRFAEIGHTVVYGSRDPARASTQALVARTGGGASAALPAAAAAESEVVVLAVPWDAIEQVVMGLGDLSGKIVIDPTNPRITAPDGRRDFAFEGSNAERVQRLAPAARVVKAFNTLAAETMLEPAIAGGPVTVPLVGDDRAANARVAGLVNGIGLEGLDVGPLRHARVLEALHFLRFNAAGGPINYYLRRDQAER